jgi:hypothetical protein
VRKGPVGKSPVGKSPVALLGKSGRWSRRIEKPTHRVEANAYLNLTDKTLRPREALSSANEKRSDARCLVGKYYLLDSRILS